MRKPRSTQRSRKSTPAHLTPSGNLEHQQYGPRVGHDVQRLTEITLERTRTDAHPLACRSTKFITNFKGQVRYPRVMVEGCHLDVGQVPED
jgi:hypothetical protein